MLHIDNSTSIFCSAIIILHGPKLIVSVFTQVTNIFVHLISIKKSLLQIKKANRQPKLALLPSRDLTGISYLNQQSFLNQTGDVCI